MYSGKQIIIVDEYRGEPYPTEQKYRVKEQDVYLGGSGVELDAND